MKKNRREPILYLALALQTTAVSALLYRVSGFSPFFAISLLIAAAVAGPAMAAVFRLAGILPALAAYAAFTALLFPVAGEAAGAVLIAAYAFSAPLAVTFGWVFLKRIRDLALYALPAQALIALGGAAAYSRLHFGDWNPVRITERIGERLAAQLERIGPLFERIYGTEMPALLEKQLQQGIAASMETAFSLVMTAAYLLMGCFFLSAWYGDRRARAAGEETRLGSWQPLIPKPLPSYLYMAAYVLVLLIADKNYETWYAVFTLFGFFFVFTAVYRIRGFFCRKRMPEALRALICGALLALAWLSSSSAGFSAYTALLFFGWWSATSRIMIRFRKEK